MWAASEAGILITGNVVIDKTHVESAGNVCVHDERIIPKMKAWADAAKEKNNHIWVQISHAGRQTNKFSTFRPLAPSEVQLRKMGLFGKPRAMTEQQIQDVINAFVKAAAICKKSGFTGIQIHGAHGYLISQFLSPLTNRREDQWGGDIENRSRLLRVIIEKTRAAVGPAFPISVKLNSSDFQRGGFSEEDSLDVIKMLHGRIDLLEISGGTYEKLVFFEENANNPDIQESTKKREAYFMDFAHKVRAVSTIPLLITGGFRTYAHCNDAIAQGELDFIGMARPFITNHTEIKDFIKGKVPKLENLIIRTGMKSLEDAAEGGFYARQLVRLSKGKPLDLKMGALRGSVYIITHELIKSIKNKLRIS